MAHRYFFRKQVIFQGHQGQLKYPENFYVGLHYSVRWLNLNIEFKSSFIQ